MPLEDAARLLNIHPNTLRKQVAAKVVPGAKLGRSWVFVEADLLAHIRANYAQKAVLPCLSIDAKKVASGTSTSTMLGIGYAAQLDTLIERKLKKSTTRSR